jgi:hypothetical protein
MMNDTKKATYSTFLNDVNLTVESQLGFSIHDLPDFRFADYWDADIANHPADYKNMVEACAEDFIYENTDDWQGCSHFDGYEGY